MRRAPLDPFRAAAREEGAQVGRQDVDEILDRRRRFESRGEKGAELSDVAAIGFERVGRELPLQLEMAEPGGDTRGKVWRCGKREQGSVIEGGGHRRQDAPCALTTGSARRDRVRFLGKRF
jgi:hypothetical protein